MRKTKRYFSMKRGNKGKSAEVDDNFNMEKKIKRVKKKSIFRDTAEVEENLEKVREAAEQRKADIEKREAEKNQKKNEEAVSKAGTAGDDNVEDELFNDLLHAYKTSVNEAGKKGRQRLVEMMANDSDFKFAMKELLKLASAAKVAKIKTKEIGGVSNVTTFVILKGLHDDVVMQANKEDSVIDVDQIIDAVNPTSEPKIEYKPEIEQPH